MRVVVVMLAAALLASWIVLVSQEGRLKKRPDSAELRSAAFWLDQSREAASRVPDDEARRGLLLGVLRLQAQSGEMTAATQTREQIEQEAELRDAAPQKRLHWHKTLAEAFASAGQFDAALAAAQRAMELISEVIEASDAADNSAEKARFLKRSLWGTYVEIARQQALHGEIADAKSTAEQIDEPAYRARALGYIAYEEARRDFPSAVETLKSAPVVGRVRGLGLARQASEAGRWGIFGEIIRLSLERAEETPPQWQAIAYRDMAQALSEADQQQIDPSLVERVREAIMQFLGTVENADAADEGIRGLILLGQLEEAHRAIARLGERSDSASALNVQLAEALARAERYDDALEAAARAYSLHEPFRSVAKIQAQNGDFETAKRTARRAAEGESRNWAYYEIATLEVERGRFEQVLQTVAKISAVDRPGQIASATELRLMGLHRIARAQIEAGRQDDARETLQRIRVTLHEGTPPKADQLADIAALYLELGDVEQARTLAEQAGSVEPILDLAEQHLKAGRQQDFEQAMDDAERLLKSSDRPQRGDFLPDTRTASLYLRAGQPERATKWMENVLAAAGSTADSSSFKALYYAVAAAFYAHTDQMRIFWEHAAAADPADRAAASFGAAMMLLDEERWNPWSEDDGGPERSAR